MSDDDRLQTELDAAAEEEQNGKGLEVLGWAAWFMSGITCVWIFVGWRAYTWFWFWWTLGLGLLGGIVKFVGALLRQRGAENFAILGDNMRRSLASHLEAQEQPLPKDEERRAA